MFLNINIFWALLRAHFNFRLRARAKMSPSAAKEKIFIPVNINSVLLHKNKIPFPEKASVHQHGRVILLSVSTFPGSMAIRQTTKKKKNGKSTTYLCDSSVPARLPKTRYVAKIFRARGHCLCWSADGKRQAWRDGCGQRGHWEIPGTLQRLEEIRVVLILGSIDFCHLFMVKCQTLQRWRNRQQNATN